MSSDVFLFYLFITVTNLRVCVCSLLERMLECAVSDNRECAAAMLPEHTENAVRLLHVVQDFLQAEGLINPALWSERLLEHTVTLMDGLMVWYTAGTQWLQLSQLGLRLLLGFMAQPDPQVSVCRVQRSESQTLIFFNS